MRNLVTTFVLLFILKSSNGREYTRQQQYNSNSDFLRHEANGGLTVPKTDNVQPLTNPSNSYEKRDYVSQFPALGSSSLPSQQTTSKPNQLNLGSLPKTQSTSSKRDYVAPHVSSLKPASSTGTVKDLVNFYDSKNKNQNNSQKIPTYSSILQGSNSDNKPGSAIVTSHTNPTTKPQSFSAAAAGSHRHGTVPSTSPKPSTRPLNAASKPIALGNSSPTIRPSTPVLPSSIVSNNKNNNPVSNGPTDAELQTISEELLRKDVNNAAKYITINYQEKTTSQSTEDKAPNPLLTVAADAWNIATIQKFLPLLDNYERDTLVNEYVTPQERNEENAFMDAIMSTSVIRHLMSFFKDKGYVSPDPRQQRDFLKQLWFNLYSRGKGKLSSSGFEHVFLSELKNDGVLGLHNWIYFAKEELANRVNYLGYLKYSQLNDKGIVMKLHFTQQGIDKPVNSMFIGTSPELEIALYTLCFVTRADNDCKLKLSNKDVDIVTHTFRYRSKNHIGSAYPQI